MTLSVRGSHVGHECLFLSVKLVGGEGIEVQIHQAMNNAAAHVSIELELGGSEALACVFLGSPGQGQRRFRDSWTNECRTECVQFGDEEI